MNKEQKYWFNNKTNVKKLIIGILTSCSLLLLLDLFYEKHPLVPIENWFGFYCFFSFIVGCVIVFCGNLMRRLLMRKEDFYDE